MARSVDSAVSVVNCMTAGLFLAACAGPTAPATQTALSAPLLYVCDFDNPAALRDWRLEGGHGMRIVNGNLVLDNADPAKPDDPGRHLVAWLDREIPADFLLEFTFRPENRQRGLAIVFFNARGANGEDIFSPALQPRDGTFVQYHSGDIDNYHTSYWAGGERGTAHVRKNRGFHLVAHGPDLVRDAPPDAFQTVRIRKQGGAIRVEVDGRLSVAYDDDGKTHGPVHAHAGRVGLRQMAHSRRCEYGEMRVYSVTR
jgi:hypothetical protein